MYPKNLPSCLYSPQFLTTEPHAAPLDTQQFCSYAPKEGIWKRGGIAPLILNVGMRWAEMSASGPGRFTTREKFLQYTQGKRLDEIQRRSGWLREQKNFLAPDWNRTTSLQLCTPQASQYGNYVIPSPEVGTFLLVKGPECIMLPFVPLLRFFNPFRFPHLFVSFFLSFSISPMTLAFLSSYTRLHHLTRWLN